MNATILATLFRVAWRRRYLLIVPLLILLPATVMLALSLPRLYESAALLMLQESDALQGSRRGITYEKQIAAKIKGIDALLKSQFILSKVVTSIDPELKSPVDVGRAVENLRGRISVEPVGDSFMRIALRGEDRQVLATHLNLLITQLFEVLLNPADGGNDAKSFLAQSRANEIARLETQLRRLETEAPDLTPATLQTLRANRTADRQTVEAKTLSLETTQRELSQKIAGAIGAETTAPLASLISERARQIAQANEDAGGSVDRARTELAELRALQPLAERAATLQREIAALEASAQRKANELERLGTLLAEKQRLQSELAQARQNYRRVVSSVRSLGSSGAFDLLKAPALVRVVDPPTDPIQPLTSVLKILLAGTLGAILVSLGLAQAAEQFDTSLRGTDHLEQLTGVPTIARIKQRVPQAMIDPDRERSGTPEPTEQSDLNEPARRTG